MTLLQGRPCAEPDESLPRTDPCGRTASPHAAASAPDRAAHLAARLERAPFTRCHLRARILMGSATFLDAFDALALAFILPILSGLWALSPVEIGSLIAAGYVGQFVGALMFSRLAESFGRVISVAAATLMMSVMSLGCAAATALPMLLICRLVQGIGVGGEMPVAATYVSELSRANGRGRFFLLYEMIFPVGMMATGQIATWLVPAFGWRTLFLIGGIPGLVLAVRLTRLPESPRWLISRGRFDEAEAVIAQIEASARRHGRSDPAGRAGDAAHPASAPEAAAATHPARPGPAPAGLQSAPQPASNERSRWAELLSPFYRGRSLIVWTLWASAFFVANGLNNWMPTLYHTLYGLPLRDALRAASMTNVAQVVVLLFCAFLIDRIGRRHWTVACFAIGAPLLAALALGGAGSLVLVMVLATLAYGIIGSVATVLYLYTPEIYPTRMRSIGTGLATSWLRLASAASPALVGLIVTRHGIGAVFLMFAAVAVIGAGAATRMVETRNRALEHIAP